MTGQRDIGRARKAFINKKEEIHLPAVRITKLMDLGGGVDAGCALLGRCY